MKLIILLFAFAAFSLYSSAETPDTIIDKNGKSVLMHPFSMNWENNNSKLNLSFLLEKPAGKEGFITIKDGHLVKPNGERFRIWGANLTGGACFPEKKDAPVVAAYLARFGINAVRLHFLDSNWGQDRSLFDLSSGTTRKLYPPQVDKLDFFIAELKKAGIYTDINLNVGRNYLKDDKVPEYEFLGLAKAVTLFDDHIISLEKEYAKQLLTHVNPYTGNAYTDEPAIIIVELVNENSLVEAWFGNRLLGEKTTPGGGTWVDIPPYYGKELTQKYNKWIRQSRNLYPSDIERVEEEAGVKAGEEIPRLKPSEFKNASDLRFRTEAEFIIDTEKKFYTSMYDYLKKDLKVKAVVAANSDHSHYKSGYALLSNTARLDVVDGHVYWEHPSDRTDEKTGKKYSSIINSPMVNNPEFSTVVQLARSAVEGKPYTVSETNHPFPNEYACEGIPILGTYALLQDWDGIFYYTLEHVSPDKWNTNYGGSFGMAMDPVKMPGMAATAILFHRGDIKPAESCVYRGYNAKDLVEGIRTNAGERPFFTEGFSQVIPLMQKTRVRSFSTKISDYPEIKKSSDIRSETGEIVWHAGDKSYIEVSAPKNESLIGFIPEKTTMLKHLNAGVENEFAAITLTSLDGKPIESSAQMLLTATGRSGMRGMKWNDKKNSLSEPGAKPTTIEVIKGKITLKGLAGKTLTIEPLDGSGNPLNRKKAKVKKGAAVFDIGKDVTVWYYLTVK